jgi:hypothetical protein
VEFFGMLTRQHAVADHGIFVHADQAAGFSHPTSFVDVGQNRNDGLFGQDGAKERGSFAFRETGLASRAIKHAPLFVGAIAIANGQVASAAFAVRGALRVLTTEPGQVVHGLPSVAKGFEISVPT